MAVRLGLRAVRRFGGGRHFPFVFVWYAARGILTPGGGVPAGLARYGWYALAAALLERGDLFRRAYVYAPCGLPGGDEYAKGGGRPSH